MRKTIAVIGAGTMGNGIAHVCAQNGYKVNLCDISSQQLEKALKTISSNIDRMIIKEQIPASRKETILSSISTFLEISEAVKDSDLAIEAAAENVDVKKSIFKELDRACPENCILATNTSSISITEIAAVTKRPEYVVGMHFMNPVPVMKLVEIIKGYSTTDAIAEEIKELSVSLGKIPVEVNDYPGFISNRILMPMINEAIFSLFEGVSGVTQIDTVMKLGMAHPMGPLQLADFIGLDVCLAILRVLHEGFGNPKYAPCPLLVNMVAAGKLGKKSGEGFYVYVKETKEMKVSPQFNR